MKMKGLVEVCADGECSHFGESVNKKDFCTKNMKEIERTPEEIEEGAIPSWCPLPSEY